MTASNWEPLLKTVNEETPSVGPFQGDIYPRPWLVVSHSDSRALLPPGESLRLDKFFYGKTPIDILVETEHHAMGFKNPAPGQMCISVVCTEKSLWEARNRGIGAALWMTGLIAFVTNVATGTAQSSSVLDISKLSQKREYAHWGRDRAPGAVDILRLSRRINTEHVIAFAYALLMSAEQERANRAISLYHQAIDTWREHAVTNALAFLYMAAGAVAPALQRRLMSAEGMDKRAHAASIGVDVTRDNWERINESFVMKQCVFRGDHETYTRAKAASDALEHGYGNLGEIGKSALLVAAKCERHIRMAILSLVRLPPEISAAIEGRLPVDVSWPTTTIYGHWESDDPMTLADLSSDSRPGFEYSNKVKDVSYTDAGAIAVHFGEQWKPKYNPLSATFVSTARGKSTGYNDSSIYSPQMRDLMTTKPLLRFRVAHILQKLKRAIRRRSSD